MGRTVIFDNGHAGLVNGEYLTPGKRSPAWNLGTLYEGAFNRWVVNLTMRELDYAGVPYYHVSPELEDVTIQERVRRANAIFRTNPDAYLLSIHANAGNGTGLEAFTSRGETASDAIAERFLLGLQAEFEGQGMRIRQDLSDGDMDKEAGFYVIRETYGPALLLESGFMDNVNDYALLWSQDYQQALACNLAKTIIELYRNENEQDELLA